MKVADELLGVREAATRLGVHENTVRNWAREGVLEDARVPGSRFLRVRASEVERLLEQRGAAAPTLQTERRFANLEFATASQLTRWPDDRSRDAQENFPELVRRLLLETPGVTRLRMEAGDGVAQHGYDGTATVEARSAILPAGDIILELGVSKDIRRKANEEFARLSRDAVSRFAFVFATPRRWPGGEAWARERRAEGVFADVRVIDAPVLETWLSVAPGTHIWLSEHLGLRPREAVSLDRWWAKFSSSTEPRLPEQLFLAGRDREGSLLRSQLERWYMSEVGQSGDSRDDIGEHVVVETEWSDDGYAFIQSTLRIDKATNGGLPTPLLVDSERAWERICRHVGHSLLIPRFNDADIDAALNAGHSVISVVDRSHLRVRHVDVKLPRLGRREAAEAFLAAGVGQLRMADRLAVEARRSLPAFVRQHSRDPRRRLPEWARGETAALLAPLVLAQEWTERDDDVAALERLTQATWTTIEKTLRHFTNTTDPLLRCVDKRWMFVAPDEAFLILRESLTPTTLQHWQQLVIDVWLEDDPLAGLDGAELVRAQMTGTRRRYSSTLRRGFAVAVALAGAMASDVVDAAGTVGRESADAAEALVRRALALASDDASGKAWAHLAASLPLLAEGAPDAFLEAVEGDLSAQHPVLSTMFRTRASWPDGSSQHPHLLWAIETLCWSEEYLVRGTVVLARMADFVADAKAGNNPTASIASILCGWVRHTAADSRAKLAALDAVQRVSDRVGWDLVKSLLPSQHAIAFPPAEPRLRAWAPNRSDVPMSEWVEFVHQLVSRAIALADTRPERLADLANRMSALPEADRDQVLVHLSDVVHGASLSGNDRLRLWENLQTLEVRHRRFPDAEWVLPLEALDRLTQLVSDLASGDDPRRLSVLFDWRAAMAESNSDDLETRQQRLAQKRREAVEEILSSPSPLDVLADLANRARSIELLAWALAESDKIKPDDVLQWLDSSDPVLSRLASLWLQRVLYERAEGVLPSLLARDDMSSTAREILIRAVPARSSAWRLLDDRPNEADLYWREAQFDVVPLADTDEAISRLLGHGRAWTAIAVCSYALGEHERASHESAAISVSTLIEVLRTAATQHEPSGDDLATMTAYYVAELLDHLVAQQVSDDEIASLEFLYLRVLDDQREPAMLSKLLATSPDLFVDLVKNVYRAVDEPSSVRDEQDNLASQSWWVLRKWTGFPGRGDDGSVDEAALNEWVKAARLELSNVGRADIGDEVIGEALAQAPDGLDGIWPPRPVRDLLETIGSRHLENGLVIGRLNLRGVTTRGVYDGGDQERQIANEYRDMSRQTAAQWPRTSRLLRSIATSYEHDADREDREAELDSDRR